MEQARKTTGCAWCATTVDVFFFANENDRGDRGYVRRCGHGDYVPASDLAVVR